MDLIKTYGMDFDDTCIDGEIIQFTHSESPVLFTTTINSTDITNEVSELMDIYGTLLDKDSSSNGANDSYIDCNNKDISYQSSHVEDSHDSDTIVDELTKVGVSFKEYPINSTLYEHNVTLDINQEIPITVTSTKQGENTVNALIVEGMNNFRDYVKSTIDKLYETIDILKQELVEKNDLIRKLTSKAATKSTSTNSYDLTTSSRSSDISYTHNTQNVACNTEESIIETDTRQTTNGDVSKNEKSLALGERYAWQMHSSGASTRMMQNMGYKGEGLGKSENGIKEPISSKPHELDKGDAKLLYILSSSMLNQMDENRLSKGNMKVKVRCHGGCTVKCAYTHLPEMFRAKPDYLLLHIGSNDCTSKTSDEVLNEIKQLIKYILKTLPCVTILLSLPIVRADNARASVIQKNLKLKMKRLYYPCLEHSNVDLTD